MSSWLKIQPIFILFFFSFSALADVRWFQMELIIFQQNASNSEIFEQVESSIEPVSRYAKVVTGSKDLNRTYNRLKKSRNYKPLYHRSWRIAVDSDSRSLPINIEADHVNLKGWIKIQRGYLVHILADLEFSPPVDQGDKLFYRLQEKRRILLNKKYYLDHPKLGAIIKLSPVD